MKNAEQIKITVCMGSACFTRGNNQNLDHIENLIKENKLNAKLELSGARCENKCAIGPNIIIEDKAYNNVHKSDLDKILSEFFTQEK